MLLQRALRMEPLEDRLLLTIVWENEFDTGLNNSDFDTFFQENEALARAIVNRAIDDWNAVINSFNYDVDNDVDPNNDRNDTYELSIFAGDLGPGNAGSTGNYMSGADGRPHAANIFLDNDAGGDGWFFDSTPDDDAEFTGIASPFFASFVDATNSGNTDALDFYFAMTHEIGHAMGLGTGFSLNAITDFLTRVEVDMEPVMDPVDETEFLEEFHNPAGQFGVRATFTTATGRHFFEGPAPANLPDIPIHPNELMNDGRTFFMQPGVTDLATARRQISDLTVKVLADTYGYSVTLPSELDTMHATLDQLTGTLLVQGLPDVDGETIDITTEGSNVKVVVNSGGEVYTERFPVADVLTIIVADAGDTVTVAPEYASITGRVQHVVSTNEDAVDPGVVGVGVIDLDPNTPGRQVPLRAAVQEGNAAAGITGVYLPRGTYELSIPGNGGTEEGSIDITGKVFLVGAGQGHSVVDATNINDTAFTLLGDLDADDNVDIHDFIALMDNLNNFLAGNFVNTGDSAGIVDNEDLVILLGNFGLDPLLGFLGDINGEGNNGDGVIDNDDLVILLGNFGIILVGDLNSDGVVDELDQALLQANSGSMIIFITAING